MHAGRRFRFLPLRWPRSALCLAGLVIGLVPLGASEPDIAPAAKGLPFTRSYPLEDIGDAARGAFLGFDARGRFRVSLYGSYWVLNDTVWTNLLDRGTTEAVNLVNLFEAADGRTYYGGRGSWGWLEPGPDGRLRTVSADAAQAPPWTEFTSFDHIDGNDTGVVFAGRDGVVRWDFATAQSQFHAVENMSEVFSADGQIYVSAHGSPLRRVDPASPSLVPVPGVHLGDPAVRFATPLDRRRTLLCLRDDRLVVFDGHTVTPWEPQDRLDLHGDISAIHHLVDGGLALAVTGRGLFLLTPDDKLDLALTTQPYHHVTGLAANEPGVLWVGLDDSIEKVLYGNPLSRFDQRLGLPLTWPGVTRWRDRLLVSSSGELYESEPAPRGHPTPFHRIQGIPTQGAWHLAVDADQLLVTNRDGVFTRRPSGEFEQILAMPDVLRLAVIRDGLCLVLGQYENAVLRRGARGWTEAAPRIPAAGYPAVITTDPDAAVWIEFGTNRIARLTFADGALHQRVWTDLPWSPQSWVNIGIAGDTVVLTGSDHDRLFIDRRSLEFRPAPDLSALLNRSPHWITRVTTDEHGTLWGTHDQGIVLFQPSDDGYTVDTATFDLVRDHFPFVSILPDNDIWIATRRSLFHVETRPTRPGAALATPRPTLVSLVNERTGHELIPPGTAPADAPRLPFDQSHLSFRFFAGTYAWLRPPRYEYRLNNENSWATLAAGSPLSLSGLHEGDYRLDVRLAGAASPSSPQFEYKFEVLPPWYRTRLAYAAYLGGLLLGILGIVRWTSQHARRRNLMLENLVQERTREIETIMGRLRDETRHSATLAERQRIAGEIHDSVQQGLSGLLLQIDSTLRLSSLAEEVRARLHVARNMVSFTRQEVQNAVWDLESPLLNHAQLGDALRQLVDLIHAGEVAIGVQVSGSERALPSATTHHLLRAAQEAITNAVRHAAARHITVTLDYGADTLELTVADDGVGFTPSENLAKALGHFGLRGLRSRAAKIDGALDLDSSPGSGTRVRLAVPLLAAATV